MFLHTLHTNASEEISVQQIIFLILPTDLFSVYLAIVQFLVSHEFVHCSDSNNTDDHYEAIFRLLPSFYVFFKKNIKTQKTGFNFQIYEF